MFDSVGRKLTALIALAIAAGFFAVGTFYAYEHQKNILRQNERTIHKLTESVIQGMQTAMLAGYADVAKLYAERLKTIGGVVDFRILRVNGEEAFRDNETIRQVNALRGDHDFKPRPDEPAASGPSVDDTAFRQAVDGRRYAYYYGEKAGERTLTFLWPILNDKDCHRCHAAAQSVRGVLEFTTSLAAVEAEVGRTWRQAGAIMGGALLITVVVVAAILRRSVVVPIENASRAMQRVSEGDLSQAVPVIGRDELAEMAQSFNAMLQRLRDTYAGFRAERDKLETIILGSLDGIVVTDAKGAVVLVNPAAERLLGKSARRLVDGGFERLVDDDGLVGALIEHRRGDVDIVNYGDSVLAVSAAQISDERGRPIGRAALLRDVTQEKRLEGMLRTLSHTDGLTGLANRRLLDEVLAAEVVRATGHGHPLAILMFDVDRFKLFNDDHGHDQGDRVLRAVAEVARQCVRSVDLACRYGGEEFLVILTETTLAGAVVVAERLRESVEAMPVDGLTVTVSVGVAALAASLPATPAALIERADAALYAAKRGGRNCVRAATGVGA